MSAPNNPPPNDPRYQHQGGQQPGADPHWNPYQPGGPYQHALGTYPRMGQYQKQSNATTVLVLGILSIPVCQPLGIVAWIMGKNAISEMDRGIMDPSDRGLATAGMVCGIVGTVFFALGCLYFLFVMLVMGAAGAMGGR